VGTGGAHPLPAESALFVEECNYQNKIFPRKSARSLHKNKFSPEKALLHCTILKFSPEIRKDVEYYSQMPGKRILEFSRSFAPSALASGCCALAACALFQRLHLRVP
jgi:hypothetical protein